MPRKLLVADLLCGAGGSSTGASRALRGLRLEMELVCVNHWPTAIETHQRNHPEARHYVQDIATVTLSPMLVPVKVGGGAVRFPPTTGSWQLVAAASLRICA